jgi:hypothetical protein
MNQQVNALYTEYLSHTGGDSETNGVGEQPSRKLTQRARKVTNDPAAVASLAVADVMRRILDASEGMAASTAATILDEIRQIKEQNVAILRLLGGVRDRRWYNMPDAGERLSRTVDTAAVVQPRQDSGHERRRRPLGHFGRRTGAA